MGQSNLRLLQANVASFYSSCAHPSECKRSSSFSGRENMPDDHADQRKHQLYLCINAI